ncbi:MAG: hypothetical protein OEV40_31405 [Acidimicrobiia bacterium]|nr:hypothetical protein [Acidimicrobiia bacterium]
MLARAGFDVIDAEIRASIYKAYTCRKVAHDGGATGPAPQRERR